MSDEEAEFERVKTAILGATDVLAGALEREGQDGWDYMIVAVPHGRQTTRIGMMSSVMPEQLPAFIAWLFQQFKQQQAAGRVMDDRQPEGKPS